MQDFVVNTLSPLLQALITVMIPVVMAMGTSYLKKKTGIEIKQATLAFVENAAIQAAMQVEGRATRKFATKGQTWTGATKHGEAVNKLLAMAPDLSVEDAKHYIDMAVARIPGLGPVDLVTREVSTPLSAPS